MLNKDGNRELAYIVAIDEIKPIPNYDKVEHARVGGWWVIVRKDQFQVGDLAIYIEVDAKVPEEEPFMFLEKRHFKVKTLKMCKVLSQGLLMSPEDFGWTQDTSGQSAGDSPRIKVNKEKYFIEGDFVTEFLKITYAEIEDNNRKAASADKYKLMAQRHGKLFSKKPIRWLMKRKWGRKLLFIFFGKKKDKKNGWPVWVVKTDEERCQNMSWLFPGNDEEWIATEKIDGTSTTFTMKGFGREREFYICSRNVVFDTPSKKCYYETNVYTEMAEKYSIKEVLARLMDTVDPITYQPINPVYVTIQGETYGEGIQKRTYGLEGHDFMAFNLIFGMPDGRAWRLNPVEMTQMLQNFNIPCVPIIDEHFKIPATCEELLQIASGNSVIDGGMREGLVFRSKCGTRSFKAVSNDFLLKYHS